MAYDIYWNNVVLAMHMDDTGLTDVKGHAVTLNGNSARSATQSKFGGYSASFDGSGDYLSLASSTDFAFGTGDFTVAFFVYLGSAGTQYMMQSDAVGTSTSDKWWIGYVSGQLGIGQHATANKVVFTCTMSTSAWYHVEVVRKNGVTFVFLDGTLLGSATTFSATSFSQNGFTIGAISTPTYLTGYIDDLVITKGVGRHTGSFTVPAVAFPERFPAISGVITDSSSAYIKRLVRIFDRETAVMLGQTESDVATGAYSLSVATDKELFGIAYDTTSYDIYWNNVVLAMHMDDIALSDVMGHPVALGSVVRSATQSKFGGYSASFNGSTYLSIADAENLELAGGDFTVETFVYITAYSTSYSGFYRAVLVGKDTSGARSWHWAITGTASSWTGFAFSTAGAELTASYSFSNNTWYHVAVCKSGTNLRFYVDGAQVGTTQTHNTTFADVATAVTIGAINYTGFQYYLNGYIDDLRLTKAARYTGTTYTVPTATFVEGVSGGTENALILDRLVPL